MRYKTTVDGWDRWRNPYQMMCKTTVDGWDQWRTTHIRWSTNNYWWTRHMKKSIPDDVQNSVMDETNEGLRIPDEVQNTSWWMRQIKETIPDEVQNNCWWMRQMKESIPDGVWNNCWWMRPMKDYHYQMRYKTTVDEWNRWRNPFQMRSKTKYWPTNIRCKEKLIGQCS